MLVITPHAGEVSAVAWNPDGESLASVSVDRRVKLWDLDGLASGTPRWDVVGHAAEINHAQFSPNGTELYTCGTEGVVRVWDADDGKLLRETRSDTPLGRLGSVNALVLSLDGQQLAWGGGSWFGTADVVVGGSADLVPGRRLSGHRGPIAIIATHEGGWISGGVDRVVRFWDRDGGVCKRTIPAPAIVRGLSVNREGTVLAVSAGSSLSLWNLPGTDDDPGRPPRERPLRGHTSQIECVELSPDGNLLATAALDGTLRVWDVASGDELRAFAPGLGPLHWVTFAPDRPALAFSSHKGHVGLIDYDV